MPDYLEECLDNVERLLEQVRQSERRMPGPGPEEGGSGERLNRDRGKSEVVSEDKDKVYNQENAVDRRNNLVDNRENRPEIGEIDEKTIVNHWPEPVEELPSPGRAAPITEGGAVPRRGVVPQAEAGREADRLPLAAQLERLDRAASVPAGGGLFGGGTEGRRQYPVSLPGLPPAAYPRASLGAVPVPAAQPSAARTSFGGEMGWAEEADRAFRRDSRRYDGGFYLY